MDSYFIRENSEISLSHSYGDPSFYIKLSDFYIGPDLSFKMNLESTDLFEDDILLPIVVNTIEGEVITRKLHTNNDCYNGVLKRFIDLANDEIMVSYYCIMENSIEHHIIRTSDMEELNTTESHYLNSTFIDYLKIGKSFGYRKYQGNLLSVLSREQSSDGNSYLVHVFNIEDDLLEWIGKFEVNTNRYTLRNNNPMLELQNTPWMIFVEKSEKKLFFVSDSDYYEDYELQTSIKVKNAFTCCHNYLFLTHRDSNIISAYSTFKFFSDDIGKTILTTEFQNEIILNLKTYIDVDIDIDGLTIVLSGNSEIDVYQVDNLFNMQFVRRLPMFRYKNSMTFWKNLDENNVVFLRNGMLLYIIMVDQFNPKEKRLFIYSLNTFSHDSLISLIKLDEKLFMEDNHIFIEGSPTRTPIYIFVFYGGNIYQFFNFQPHNLLKKDNEVTDNLFLPAKLQNMATYPDNTVNITVYPDYSAYPHVENTSLSISIDCENNGLMIESRTRDNLITYPLIEHDLRLSMFDYLDGFNISFKLDYFNRGVGDPPFRYSSNGVITESYLIDSVSKTNKVKHGFIYNYLYLFLFFENDFLLQVPLPS